MENHQVRKSPTSPGMFSQPKFQLHLPHSVSETHNSPHAPFILKPLPRQGFASLGCKSSSEPPLVLRQRPLPGADNYCAITADTADRYQATTQLPLTTSTISLRFSRESQTRFYSTLITATSQILAGSAFRCKGIVFCSLPFCEGKGACLQTKSSLCQASLVSPPNDSLFGSQLVISHPHPPLTQP